MEASASSTWAPESPLDTPYHRAKQEWDSRIGSTVVQARNWRLATFLSLGLVLMSIIGLVYLGAQPKAVPHIVEIDRLGVPAYRGPVGQTARDFRPGEASIRYHLRRFIDDTRTVSSDVAVLKQNWLDAYTVVTANAANQLSTYAQKASPFERSQLERVSVEVTSMVPLSKNTWQIDWREVTWDKTGNQTASAVWRASVRIQIKLPETEEALAANPIGLYIDEFHWSRVQG